MAYLAAANVTVTLTQDDIDRSPDRVGIRTYPTVAFGNGFLQYPALGIPMPSLANFGFNSAIKRVFIEQPANGFIYHFDRANHKLRIFLGAAVSISVANHTNIALPTPTGNLANLAAGTFTGDEMANITPTGNLANLAAAAHSHSLVIAGNGSHTGDVDVLAVEANSALCGNVANAITIPGDLAANGGIANTTPGNGSGDFVGDAISPGTPTGNIANGSGDFVGDAPANLANLTHTVTGGTAEAALAEMDDGVAPAATTLYMEMVGR